MGDRFSHLITDFHGRAVPERVRPAGYAALSDHYTLKLPLPPRLTAIAERHQPTSTNEWQLLSPRHAPDDTLLGHLEFALKWEGIDLGVLAALFRVVEDREIVKMIRSAPTGAYTRRLWYLYEWLTGRQLNVPDPGKVRAVPIVDPKKQFALLEGTPSPRHKVIDNLPGTRAFCPMVRRTPLLEQFVEKKLDQRASEIVGRTHADVIRRAAAFLLLKDSESSFQIEGEQPSTQRMARWGKAIGEAGSRPLSIAELERLQRIVIGDSRLVHLGLRQEGGFVGIHDRRTQEPIPDHISARPEDLKSLIEGIVAYDRRSVPGRIDALVAAASIAFGFVYVHPFEDGNGRLHRWLIHHELANAGYNPPGVVFPVSAAILRETEHYRKVLESYSRPLLDFIDWEATATGNVRVENDTADYYRYFDATAHAEFLYKCVEQTIVYDLPEEIGYLEAYDRFSQGVQDILDMPNQKIDLIHHFLRQGQGHLSTRARTKEFAALTNAEIKQIEGLYAQCFGKKQNESWIASG
ncbi:MAG: Fic family protein [candidate division NC10 bacterium]|nr:Fic family protein [candidate division NC10 bacterium]